MDTNVLVHAANSSSVLHAVAAELVERGLREKGLYCIAPQNLTEFAAVMSRARWMPVAMPLPDIARIATVLYRSRRLSKVYPRRGTILRAIQEGNALGITGPRWYDLFLAITMRDAGIHKIVTDNTRDFRQFPFVNAIPLLNAP
ncbi:MAG: type II toxin-antitoxin system VapC family toxin [Terriglobales bacterium]